MPETWRPVPGLPGVMVSTLDRVNQNGIVRHPDRQGRVRVEVGGEVVRVTPSELRRIGEAVGRG